MKTFSLSKQQTLPGKTTPQSLLEKASLKFATGKCALFCATLIAAIAIPSASMAEHNTSADWQMLNNQQSDSELSDGSQYDQQGQANDKPKRKRKLNWNRLADKLNLDDSQKSTFIEVMNEQHKKRKAIKKNSGIREAMDAVDTELQQSLASVLNEEQLANFIDHQENRKKRRHKGRHQGEKSSDQEQQL
jgi:hypothetical protein